MAKVAEELRGLIDENPLLQTQTVVDWARENKDSALHGELDWDDKEAGERWRNCQVRRLIAIHVVSADTGIREAVSLSIDRVNRDGGGYREIGAVLKVPSLREILFNDAMRELDRLRKKFETLTELTKVWQAVDTVKKPQIRQRPAAGKGGRQELRA